MPSNTSPPHYMDGVCPPSYDDLEKLIHLVGGGDLHSTRTLLAALPDSDFAAVTKAVLETRQHHRELYEQILRLIALEAVIRNNSLEA